MAWIIEGGTPFSASDVAPPACRDCPAVSESKKQCKHLMKKEHVGTAPLLVSQRGELRGNLSLHDTEVCGEELVGIEDAVILSNNNFVPFKESVGLMARQKSLKRCVANSNRVAFGDFPRVTKIRVVWIRHFTQTEKRKKSGQQLCYEEAIIVISGVA
jgi:hypothetical protein